MVSTNPPSGFRDFINNEARLRLDLVHRIAKVYQSFGFLPLETPALENLNVLQGSGGGDENEKLIFKVMKRGEKLKESLSGGEEAIAEFGLRFDMTVPLSRVTAEYRGQIHFPWKVFHIGPVWRAERAQKGRFREFTQCDVDIVGSRTWAAELEVIQAVVAAIDAVGAKGFELRINDRRLLQALADKMGLDAAGFNQFAILLDKKDKLDPSALKKELADFLGQKMNAQVEAVLNESLSLRDAALLHSEAGENLERLISSLRSLNLPLQDIVFDPSLARGLGYYTGTVFELRHSSAGYSFGGGGRYDKLIGRFSKEAVPACGFSIGFERLFSLLREAEQAKAEAGERGIFVPVFDENLRLQILEIAKTLRQGGIDVDVYPDSAKLKAQFKFASDRGYRWVLIAGEDEMKSGELKLKDFSDGSEKVIKRENLIKEMGGLG